ncbi:hypothetical protein CYY_007951 [Polysphondylium violaceum]|uniref:EGF-like domain-containing protein n=1 Tax=Polysphondylium violaceum TaxID=133409 RepID=A0A8J4PWC4_9MYCE|nr:hypothetical protein CYY_007951 [Polysphondylium violaceum]
MNTPLKYILLLGISILFGLYCTDAQQQNIPTVVKIYENPSVQSSSPPYDCSRSIMVLLELNGFDIKSYELKNSTYALIRMVYLVPVSSSLAPILILRDTINTEIQISTNITLTCDALPFPLEMKEQIIYAPLTYYQDFYYLSYKIKGVGGPEGTTIYLKEEYSFFVDTPQYIYRAIKPGFDPSLITSTSGNTKLTYSLTDSFNRTTSFTIPTFFQDYQSPGQVKDIWFYPLSNKLSYGLIPIVTMEVEGNLAIPSIKRTLDGFPFSYYQYLYPVSRLNGKTQYIAALKTQFIYNQTITLGVFNSPLSRRTKVFNMTLQDDITHGNESATYTMIDKAKALFIVNFKLQNLQNRSPGVDFYISNNGTIYSERYGIGKGTELSYEFTISSLKSYQDNVSFGFAGRPSPTTLSIPVPNDNTPPQTIDITIERLPQGELLFRVHAIDDLSGVSEIEFSQTGTKLSLANLVSGTPLDGVFEIRARVTAIGDSVGYSICDKANNCKSSSSYPRPFYTIDKLVPTVPDYDSADVEYTHFSFEQNNLDLSTFGVFNTVYLNSTNVNLNSVPIISIQLTKTVGLFEASQYDTDNMMEWDPEKKLFKKTFFVPPRLFKGTVEYLIFYKSKTISSSQMYQKFKEASELRVLDSENPDEMPPIVSRIEFSPSSLTINSNQQQTIILIVDIEDPINGLDYGSIKIGTDYDSFIGYSFDFKPSDAINKDPFFGTYHFKFNINGNCRSQNYYIKSISLVDTSGHQSNTLGNIINPLFKLYDSTSLYLPVQCTIQLDSIPPVIKSLQFSKTIFNNNNLQRGYSIRLTTQDDISGISLRHNPIVFIEADDNGFDQVEMKLDSYDSNSKTANYYATSTLAFNLGSDTGLIVSVYGLYDNHLNTNGYSAEDLRLAGLLSFINTTFVRGPVIEDANPISSLGGELYLFGKNFKGTNVFAMIDYLDGQGYQTTRLFSKHTGSSLSIVGVIPKSKSFFVKLSSDAIESNEFLVIPVPAIDENVNFCFGNPVCGGPEKGYCASKIAGCVCFEPYSGISCSNKNINTDPNVQNKPDIDNEFDIFKYKISVLRIDEMDINSKAIKSHPLSDWVSKNVSTTTRKEYQYSTEIKNNDTPTPIDINIIFFDKLEQVIFANNEYYMTPNSIKYIISLGSYSFSSSLNTLQLVMATNFTINSNETCSSVSAGNSSLTSEYFKFKVNDGYLYSRFVKLGVIDKRPQPIINVILPSNDEKESNNLFSQIGIRIPFYTKNALLDPDFSVLIDSKSAKEEENSFCGKNIDDQDIHQKRLSTGAIIGIVFGCVGLVAIVTISIVIYINRRRIMVHSIKLKKFVKKN